MAEQPEYKKRELTKPVFTTVSALEPGGRGYNLYVKVVSVQPKVTKTRTDGQKLSIAEARVGDATGNILFTLKNEQIDMAKIGENLIVRNAKIDMFSNHMRLAVDRWGVIEPASPNQVQQVANEPDMSQQEYELVE